MRARRPRRAVVAVAFLCRRATCGGSGALLRRVFFLQPLLLDGDVRSLRVVCELNAPDERLEVRSERGAGSERVEGASGIRSSSEVRSTEPSRS